MALPILYSLRNCPFAMRARIAIYKSKQPIALRDIVLSNKPEAMIIASPKATVPVLVLPEPIQEICDGEVGEQNGETTQVIDESFDIMLWALNHADPNDLLHKSNPALLNEMLALINDFDVEFKVRLEAYKCAKRYHESTLIDCRVACEAYIQLLETRLTKHEFLFSEKESLADIAILPFIRQFARVERQWYLQSPYPNLQRWLNGYLQSPMFTKVMAKYPLWLDSGEDTVFVGS